jgi:hypothetical protein
MRSQAQVAVSGFRYDDTEHLTTGNDLRNIK